MATKTKAAPSKSKAVVSWDQKLAEQAQVAAGMEASTAGGQFISAKGGILTFNDVPFERNQMAAIVLDSILENVFYEGTFDPDVPQGPTCFAFARVEDKLKPHEVVVKAGNDIHSHCAGCPMNEFGSADIGRGKACRNTRRLAIIPAGSFDDRDKLEMIDDPQHYASAALAFLKLPVTSVKGYSAFVKQVSGALKRPPHGVIVRIKAVPDPKSTFKLIFEAICKVPDELMEVIMQRNEEAKAVIDFPYTPRDDEAEAKKPVPPKNAAKEKAKAALEAKRGSKEAVKRSVKEAVKPAGKGGKRY